MFNEVKVTCADHSPTPNDSIMITGLRGEPGQELTVLLDKAITAFRKRYECEHRLNVFIKTEAV